MKDTINIGDTKEMLCEMLQKQGVPIARRTVAKYRTCAGIPSARSRRRL